MVSNCLFPTPIRPLRCFTYRAKPRFPDRWRLGSMLQAGAKRSSCQVAAAGRSCISRELCLAIWQPIEASEILQSGVIRRCRSNTSERRRAGTMSRDHFREASQRCATARTPRSCVPPSPYRQQLNLNDGIAQPPPVPRRRCPRRRRRGCTVTPSGAHGSREKKQPHARGARPVIRFSRRLRWWPLCSRIAEHAQLGECDSPLLHRAR